MGEKLSTRIAAQFSGEYATDEQAGLLAEVVALEARCDELERERDENREHRRRFGTDSLTLHARTDGYLWQRKLTREIDGDPTEGDCLLMEWMAVSDAARLEKPA